MSFPTTWNPQNHQTTNNESRFFGISKEYLDIGDATYVCSVCKAKVWHGEARRGNKDFKKTCYSICCYNGKVQLPNLFQPPQLLVDLYQGTSEKSKNFIQNIRRYNMMFAFTSMGGKLDHYLNNGGGPYVYRMHGQNYHIAGSLLPDEGEQPKFAQLYIYDTDHEVDNRVDASESVKKNSKSENSMSNPCSLEFFTIYELKGLLDFVNPLVKQRMARDRFSCNPEERIRLKIVGIREKDGRQYNLPSTNEVAALIIGDIDGSNDARDILLETQTRQLQRISELHPQYLALQYPLLFPYADDGYRVDILHRGVHNPNSKGRIKLTMRVFFSYRIQQRINEVSLILRSRKLFHQFLVDSYTMVENERLSFIRYNQKSLRVAKYSNLANAVEDGIDDASSMGQRFTLPSSFTGGARYMQQHYLDAMTICKSFGYPDLFLTLTCNPKWPEIIRFVEAQDLKPEDRPDILSRIFKLKLDLLVTKLKDESLLGEVLGIVYTIEFQKRGLPHCHLCLFMEKTSKFQNPEDINRGICAELPDKELEPDLFQIVCDNMIHGPCGNHNPLMQCMRKGRFLLMLDCEDYSCI